MTLVPLNASDSSEINTAVLQSVLDYVGADGHVEVSTPGTFSVLNLRVDGGRTLTGPGVRLMSPVLEAHDGSPIAWVTGAGSTVGQITFDGQRDAQPFDGYSDSWDGGGTYKIGRSYRCAIRADINSGIDGQSAPHDLTVDGCSFERLYGCGVGVVGGSDTAMQGCRAYETNFELLRVAVGYGPITVRRNQLTRVGTGHASVNSDGFILGQGDGVVFEDNVAHQVERNLVKISCDNTTARRNTMVGGNTRWRGAPGSLVGSYPAFQVVSCSGFSSYQNTLKDVGSGYFVTQGSSNVDIDNNSIDATNGGNTPDGVTISAGCSSVRVRGNKMSGISRHGVYFSGSIVNGAEVIGNRMAGGAGSGAGAFFSSSDSFQEIRCEGNNLSEFEGQAAAGLITMLPSGAGTFDGVIVRGNHIDASAEVNKRAVFWHGAGDFVSGVLSGNVYRGVFSASAAFVSLAKSQNVGIS